MDDAVKQYKKRRSKRLKARLDSDKIEWITTESGLHIPLKGGVASSGPLKGTEFKSAVSTGGGKKLGEKRKQIAATGGRVKNSELAAFNDKAYKSIVDETGYSEPDAKVFHQTLLDYLGGDYRAFGKGSKKEAERVIDDGLSRMGSYDGEVYRGLHFPIERAGEVDRFADMNIGDEISPRSVTSWSSDEDVAWGFASAGLAAGNSVIMTCKNNKSGVGVQHISKFRDQEAEVLTPSKVGWKVTGKKVMSQYDVAKEMIERYNNKGSLSRWEQGELADMKTNLRQRRKDLKKYKVVFLEVEEV